MSVCRVELYALVDDDGTLHQDREWGILAHRTEERINGPKEIGLWPGGRVVKITVEYEPAKDLSKPVTKPDAIRTRIRDAKGGPL